MAPLLQFPQACAVCHKDVLTGATCFRIYGWGARHPNPVGGVLMTLTICEDCGEELLANTMDAEMYKLRPVEERQKEIHEHAAKVMSLWSHLPMAD